MVTPLPWSISTDVAVAAGIVGGDHRPAGGRPHGVSGRSEEIDARVHGGSAEERIEAGAEWACYRRVAERPGERQLAAIRRTMVRRSISSVTSPTLLRKVSGVGSLGEGYERPADAVFAAWQRRHGLAEPLQDAGYPVRAARHLGHDVGDVGDLILGERVERGFERAIAPPRRTRGGIATGARPEHGNGDGSGGTGCRRDAAGGNRQVLVRASLVGAGRRVGVVGGAGAASAASVAPGARPARRTAWLKPAIMSWRASSAA